MKLTHSKSILDFLNLKINTKIIFDLSLPASFTSFLLLTGQVTEELVRKKSEHNEMMIGSLEELSLHQENIHKLEHLQHWCKDLKILYLHHNLISKIENLGKLKKLENLNFSVNNIEKIENLEGCEALQKLDLTLNFIGDILSIENLKKNIFLEQLILTGNPCCDFTGYREYVIATLPQLKMLDGEDILPSERIKALQKYEEIKEKIIIEQRDYFATREKQKEEKQESLREVLTTDVTDEKLEKFWKSSSENTPEDRIEIAVMAKKGKERHNKEEEVKQKRKIKFFKDNGEPYNINEARLGFTLKDEYSDNQYILDLHVYKFLDTALINADVQPNYVRVIVKNKVFQLKLDEEVSPDKSTAIRSQTTGHLLLTMPKAKESIIPKIKKEQKMEKKVKTKTNKREFLEIDEKKLMNISKMLDIVNQSKDDFIDDPEVPPLE